MNALVTGATGFVGSHLVDALLRKGDKVTALARSAQKAEGLAQKGVGVLRGDLHDLAALEHAAQDQEIVYHVAGVVAARNEKEFFQANRDGTRNLVTAAEGAGKPRMVLVSSLAAAGPAAHGVPLSGNEPPRPVTAYGRSKLAAEQVVSASSLPWSILRPPIVYGPRDREVLKVFQLARFGIAPVFGDGTQELSAVHAADLAEALASVGHTASTTARVYYPCHPEVFTSAQFGSAVAAAMGRKVATVRIPGAMGRALLSLTESSSRILGQATILTRDKANEFFQPAWTGDPASLSQDTGWHAAHDLRTGLADTYLWYRKAGWL
jgi:nucleoside-diphosphate-sugar epimerase